MDWWEWGPEAFAEAERRDTPILLSVGYAACHWCHVMAHESFEDLLTAEQMNRDFVCLKVDREERPDVDDLYMQATVAMTGSGGWPMTVFLTPEGSPFYAGTYFPPAPRHQLPSFRQLMTAITEAWTIRRDDLFAAGDRISAALAARRPAPTSGGAPDAADLAGAVDRIAADHDQVHGGFGGAPKFPPSMVLEWLLRHAARDGRSGPTGGPALRMAETTLRRMARSGTYDQVGGGFARYSVDSAWVVPHFEKMLYDNALLARVYLHWWRLTGDPTARRVAEETSDWIVQSLGTTDGGFASSLDADTVVGGRSVEGATYVWTPAQLVQALGPDDGRWAADLTGVTADGTFEQGASTLQMVRDLDADTVDPTERARWAAVREWLRVVRSGREQPARDDKVVAAWNGLAIAALAEAGALLSRPDLLDAARTCAALLLDVHLVDGRLRRVSRDGTVGAPEGMLDDHADLAEGLLTLYAVTGQARWVEAAEVLIDAATSRFTSADENGSGLLTDSPLDAPDQVLHAVAGHRPLPADPTDNACPSGVSALAGVLVTWAALTGDGQARERAEAVLGQVRQIALTAPRFAGWGLAVAEALVDGPREVAVIGAAEDPRTVALWHEALRSTAPGLVVAKGEPGASPLVPLLADRGLRAGSPVAYPCRGMVCDLPVTGPAQLRAFTRWQDDPQ